MTASATVRPATPDDVPELVAMIRELAEYERALPEVHATEEHLRRTLFADPPAVFAHVAEVDGAVAGMAIWFLSYSTWLGAHNLYLEDLFVRPEHRGGGTGRLLLHTLATICVQRGYPRLEWWVLDWNPARGFYDALGADALTEWIPYRVDGDALARLAEPH
jgi:GNAT superfamily N-acetyltransferase